ncbi:transcriptional regulator [Nocardioides sp. JQ2195]|uniref:Rv2175c family DNA-binding protein n=1 Tax=Nocardioides sp. JQ2195 TaxID=2592334 RepID=UPI00143EB27E|nr:Rv2175c family DNA-binding protein [Nocardioides sp. JQ2195]QIX26335.1 transcriptional regulator [Nocardioides sp. JQ2195]
MNDAAAREPDLATLVDEWLDWAQTAEALGVSVNQVRTMIREHTLAAAVPVEGAGQQVPAGFVHDGQVVKGLPGLLTLFHDGGWSDRECIAWIYSDADLPGRPIDALRENRGSEVKRRAQVEAF